MSVPVDWKPERVIQAKIRDFKKRKKRKYTQKKSNDYLKGGFGKYLASVQKWQPLPGFGLLGYTPAVFWLKGFTPTVFEFSPVILSPLKVTKCLYWDVGPLSDLPMFVTTVLPLYCHMRLIHIHSCIHSMHTNIIHTWLRYYPVYYLKCILKRSVVYNGFDSEMLSIKCISSGRSHQNGLLPIPFHFPIVFSSVRHYPSKGNWQYSLSYVGHYPVKVIDSFSFRMLVITPVKVIDSIPFRMLVITPVKVIDSIPFCMLVITPVKVIDGISVRMLVITPVKVIDNFSFRTLVITPVKVIDGFFLSSDTYQFVP